MANALGKTLLVVGLSVAGLGLLLIVAGRWLRLGQLPLDIRIERPGFSIVIALGTSILISAIATLILNVVLRLRR